MEKLRMAVIGAGQIAKVTHLPNLKEMDQVEVVGICDVSLECAKALAELFGVRHFYQDHKKMLSEVKADAVIICVPNKFHSRITLDALECGCHVLCEKPPAITVEEARRMEEEARERNLILSYGFHFRHSEQVAILKEMICKEEFGTIYYASTKWNRRRGIPGWGNFTNKEMQGGGPLIDIGAHMLDAALYLLGYPKVSYVCATASDRIGKRGGSGLMGSWDPEQFFVEDGVFGFIRFENGTSLEIEASFAMNQKAKDVRNVMLYGEKLGASLFPLEIYGEKNGQLTDGTYPFVEMRDWHMDSDRNFVNACLGLEDILVTAGQGTYVQELIDALYKSADNGRPVIMG